MVLLLAQPNRRAMRLEDAIAIVQQHFVGRLFLKFRANSDAAGAKADKNIGQPPVAADHQRFVADIELAAARHVLIDLESLSFRRLPVVNESPLEIAP